ncbi:hypothetical protein HZC32_02220 [Candidatus Woesearchaeota archaeon]|nr:hypothetical protein [Candidatus Woesearchaeota archaeon]
MMKRMGGKSPKGMKGDSKPKEARQMAYAINLFDYSKISEARMGSVVRDLNELENKIIFVKSKLNDFIAQKKNAKYENAMFRISNKEAGAIIAEINLLGEKMGKVKKELPRVTANIQLGM